MPFSFFNPWFLLGALALAAPIWLHLRRKTETNVLRFSALRFLDDNPQPRRSPLRLQDILLFALRALALLLVVGAFAWPYLHKKEQAIVRESRVYLLDNTLSHQAGGGFVRERNRVADEIGKAGADVQVAVIELTGQPRVVAGFGDGHDEARQKVAEMVPSFQRGSFLAAFRQAHTLLGNSLGERKRIIFCSDNQENQWTENVNTPPFLQQVEIEMPKPAAADAPNAALSEPRLQRIFLGDKSLVNFTVKLTHSGPATNAEVALQANGQLIFRRAVELARQPGTILLQGQWEADPALWLRGVVSVEAQPDALAGDNRAFFSLAPVREGKVAVLALSPYLRLALSPDIMRGHWEARVLDPTKLADELAANKDAEVLIIESGYLQSADARKLVERYLSNGRGVFLLVNRVTPAISAELRDLGFEVASAGPAEPGREERLQYIFTGHAVFHPFVSPDYGNLLEVRVGRHARLKAAQAMPLVFSESGEGLFFQGTKFPGRLFVTAFGFEREQTSWATHVTFIPFLDLCLQNSRPEDATPLDYEPGASSVLNFPSDSPVREAVLRDDTSERQRVAVVQGKAQLRLPDQPGLYAVTYDGATEPERIFSVNPSPKESQLSYIEAPEALKLWQFERGAEAAKTASVAAPATLSLRAILQQQVWWWLLVAGLAALLAETFWTGARKDMV
jgi:hypothetical protein